MKVIIIKEDPTSPTFNFKIGDVVTTSNEQGRHWIKRGLAEELIGGVTGGDIKSKRKGRR
jgi:hypothetical protein